MGAAQEGLRELLPDARGRAVLVRVAARLPVRGQPDRGQPARGRPHPRVPLPHERGAPGAGAQGGTRGPALAPQRAVRPTLAPRQAAGLRRARPVQPQGLRGPHGLLRRRLAQGHGARPRASHRAVREGPRRHRHLPAQGRRTRTPPSSPATSTTARSPSTAPTPTPAPSTSTASSTSPTEASASSSSSSSSTSPSSTTSWAPPRSTPSSPRSSQTHIDEVIIGHTNEPEYKASSPTR